MVIWLANQKLKTKQEKLVEEAEEEEETKGDGISKNKKIKLDISQQELMLNVKQENPSREQTCNKEVAVGKQNITRFLAHGKGGELVNLLVFFLSKWMKNVDLWFCLVLFFGHYIYYQSGVMSVFSF